jgi:large subunit ribosomal protein L7/L12
MGLFDKPEDVGRAHRLDALEARVQQLEATVALLTHQQGLPAPAAPVVAGLSADVLARVQSLKREGKVIQAVKAYREATGDGLREAKAAVEAL